MKIIIEALQRAELFLFPSKCKICGSKLKPGERVICSHCISDFPYHSGAHCPVCGKPYFSPTALSVPCADCLKKRSFAIHRSAGLYEGPLRSAILLFKFYGYESLAKPLAEFASRRVKEVWDVDCIVPMPSHPKRLKQRGFDHIHLLGKALGRTRNIKVRRLLRRTRFTLPQVGLPRWERLRNPVGSFALARKEDCQRVLLLDDIWTTGATVGEASKILSRGGYEVYALTLARAL